MSSRGKVYPLQILARAGLHVLIVLRDGGRVVWPLRKRSRPATLMLSSHWLVCVVNIALTDNPALGQPVRPDSHPEHRAQGARAEAREGSG